MTGKENRLERNLPPRTKFLDRDGNWANRPNGYHACRIAHLRFTTSCKKNPILVTRECLTLKLLGKPDAANPHVRFDEGRGGPTAPLLLDCCIITDRGLDQLLP